MNPKQKYFWFKEEKQAAIKVSTLTPKLNEFTFQRTEQSLYLKVTMADHNVEDNEIQQRLNSARSFHECSKLLQSKLLSHSTR